MATTMNNNQNNQHPTCKQETPHMATTMNNNQSNKHIHPHLGNGQRPHTQQPTTPHWKASYWTKNSPLELRLKPATDMIALCSSVKVPHSVQILYPTSLRSPVLTTNPLCHALVPWLWDSPTGC
jgi:hypothetical protein